MNDRWNAAIEAAAKACEKWVDKYRLSTTHRTDDLVAAAMMCSQAILALREAEDQRGAAEQEAAGCAGTTEHSAQSTPLHPGEQVPVAWTTALAIECVHTAMQRGVTPLAFDVSPVNLWGETGVPLYAGVARPGPDVVMVPRLAWEGFVSLVNVRLGKPTNRDKTPAEIVAMARAILAAAKEGT